jgi:DNA (cytosine-5)-methyltransferase 1
VDSSVPKPLATWNPTRGIWETDSVRPPLRALGAVLGDLADLGYDAEWQGVRAADAGAPHGRFRVFLLARPADPTARSTSTGRPSNGMPTPTVNDMGRPRPTEPRP